MAYCIRKKFKNVGDSLHLFIFLHPYFYFVANDESDSSIQKFKRVIVIYLDIFAISLRYIDTSFFLNLTFRIAPKKGDDKTSTQPARIFYFQSTF